MQSSDRPQALLIRPWIEDFSAFDLWMRPLGSLRLATILRRLGIEVGLLDCLDRRSPLLEGLPPPPRHRMGEFDCGHLYREEIESPRVLSFVPRRFKRFGAPLDHVTRQLGTEKAPDVILVACMATYWYTGTFRMIRLVKSLWPQTPVVLGGIYPLLCPEHACEHSGADVVLSDPGWEAVIRSAAPYMGGISERLIASACTEPIESAFDLLTSRRSIPLLTRSGCPFRCTYCASEHINPTSVAFPPDWIVDQVSESLSDDGIMDVAFFDDALLLDPQRHSKPIFEEFARRGLPARFHTPNALHIRFIDRELAILMWRAGVRTIRLGLESDDPEFLSSSGGKVVTAEFATAMEHLRNAGFTAREVGTYVMAGLPGQSLDAIRRTALSAHRAGSEVKLALYSPTPRTQLFGNHDGFRLDPSKDPLLQNDSLVPWRSALFAPEEFQELRNWVNRLNDRARQGTVAFRDE